MTLWMKMRSKKADIVGMVSRTIKRTRKFASYQDNHKKKGLKEKYLDKSPDDEGKKTK